MFDVIIAGCGPTGATLATELRLHDVRVLVLEKDTEPVSFIRIVALHIRSLELMAMRGLLDRLLQHGRQRPAAGLFAAIPKPAPKGLDPAYAYLNRRPVGGQGRYRRTSSAGLDVPCVLLRPDGHVA